MVFLLFWLCDTLSSRAEAWFQSLALMLKSKNPRRFLFAWMHIGIRRFSCFSCLCDCSQGNGRGRVCTSSRVSSVRAIMGGISGSSGLHCQNSSNSREVRNLQNSASASKYWCLKIKTKVLCTYMFAQCDTNLNLLFQSWKYLGISSKRFVPPLLSLQNVMRLEEDDLESPHTAHKN